MADALEILKIVIIFCLFFGSILCCLVPWAIKKLKLGRKSNYIFSSLNCFSAGVILGAGLLLLLHDSNDNFNTYLSIKNGNNHDHDHDHNHETHDETNTHTNTLKEENFNLSDDEPEDDHDDHDDHEDDHDDHEDDHDDHEDDNKNPDHDEHNHDHFYPYGALCACFSLLLLITIESIVLRKSSFSGHNHASVDFRETKSVEMIEKSSPEMLESLNQPFDEEHKKISIIHAIIFTVALSLHSLFEGLGMGAESSKSALTGILIAVVIHKVLEAIALGMSIYRCKMGIWKNTILIVIYALASPIGIIISMSIDTNSTTRYLLSGIFNGIAAGSFLYIALIELIPMELGKKSKLIPLLFKIFCIVAGLGVIAGIATKHRH